MVSLLQKAEATQTTVRLDYVGFRIPNKFGIGYRRNYGQLARNLNAILYLEE